MSDRKFSPDNTADYDPYLKVLTASAPGGIEDMERQGQRQMLGATTLPTDVGYYGTDADYEALGFTFGQPVSGDPLFREAALPEGWSRKGTEHAMHSEIVDERGIARVGIFYKAAFYDRKAHMNLINVGGKFATDWIYGDTTPPVNPLFTADELRAVLTSLAAHRGNVEECPSVYEKNVPRIDSLETAVNARLAEVSS